MSIKTQKEAFLRDEADNWYLRNKSAYNATDDKVIHVLKEYAVKPGNILEIGCSSGYRLKALTDAFDGVRVTGLEPSREAIREGQQAYPKVKFIHGTADDMTQLATASFDTVIIGFVLYVVDRDILLKVISETDRVLKDGGLLLIIDFFSKKPVRNTYEHIKDAEAFAYKQNYDEVFTSSNLYQLLDRRSMSHTAKGYDPSNDYHNKYTLSTLRKDLYTKYE